MPNIIFTSRYMRGTSSGQLENYVKYIGTREGVEKIDESKKNLPVTAAQQKLIRQILRDIPEAQTMLEYEDYKRKPTIGNASEFISCALEQNMELLGKRENYVDYLANRPHVERIGEHGLFTDTGKPVILAGVQKEVVAHKGPVWTHVVSLRREDAARLGYDSGKQWVDLLRSKRAMFCKYMKIDSEDLRWYAAFHNESHHPHVHIMVYSAKDNDGFLTEPAIEAMRSELAHSIFRQDFANIYEKQNQARAELKEGAAEIMKTLTEQLGQGVCNSPSIEQAIMLLATRLQRTKGKKVYGYLKADVKKLVDQIVDELAEEPRVKALYGAWGEWNNQILKTYSNHLSPLPPLSKQKQFKSIKNMVIAEALQIGSHHFLLEEPSADPLEESGMSESEPFSEPESELESESEVLERAAESAGYADWSDDYRKAKNYLYGNTEIEQDFEKAFQLFFQEAEKGNALAMFDLARMFADGLGVAVNGDEARIWYEKALKAFQKAEANAKEKQKPYLQYRIGKMYAAGQGTDQDYKKAAKWFSMAVRQNHKYAQYSLAGLYYRGQGVVQDYKKALELYQCSAEQSNPYASYELGKMFRDGIGTEKDLVESEARFQDAFAGFLSLEAKSHDDKLQYRLGQMLYTGSGTEKDETTAAEFWEKAAKLGNVNAQYALGRYWLEHHIGDPAQAVEWIQKAAEGNHVAAIYALAKLFLEGEVISKDIEKSLSLFEQAASQGHEYAAYRLGKLYLDGSEIEKQIDTAMKWLNLAAAGGNSYAEYQLGKLYLLGEEVTKNIEEAILWLSRSAENGNQFAQYALGKLYLCGREVSRDKEKAIPLLEAAAAQGNIYAGFLLEHLDSFRDPFLFLAATRLMHQIANVFREEERKAAGSENPAIDRKLRRRIKEKKIAQGHKEDDRVPQQSSY